MSKILNKMLDKGWFVGVLWILIFVILFSVVSYYSKRTADEKNCGNFTNWYDANDYYQTSNNWIRTDQSKLDGDHDGIVCESLYNKLPREDREEIEQSYE